MSESITDVVLPGTYIGVNAQGLIVPAAIATGNIGIVGTAANSPPGPWPPQPLALSSYQEAVTSFGLYDPFANPTTSGAPLTLVRALEQAFNAGAGNVYAVRIAKSQPTNASAVLVLAAGAGPGITLTAIGAGSYGNSITYTLVEVGTGAATQWKLTLRAGSTKETFTVAAGANAVAALCAQVTPPAPHPGGSALVTATAATSPPSSSAVAPVTTPTALAGGNDFADVTPTEVQAGLAALESAPVNIVLVPGFAPSDIASVVEGHLETTLQEGNERIAVLGVTDSGTAEAAPDALNDAAGIAEDRIVLVTPGLAATDAPTGTAVTLPPSYLAAVVGGALAAVAPQVSLTNQAVNVNGIDVQYSRAMTEQLLLGRLLVVREKFGYQVVRAITTDTGGFTEISVRRIVDYAKQGIRSGADPFIGQLNDARVLTALQSTLDGFLSGMVLSEMLVNYNLDVSATPQQQIAGQVIVTINLLPVFSIDYILVTMNLGPVGS
jgi:hypothetical protein